MPELHALSILVHVQGLAPFGHLADGRLHLVLVKACSRLQFLRFLASIPSQGTPCLLTCGLQYALSHDAGSRAKPAQDCACFCPPGCPPAHLLAVWPGFMRWAWIPGATK